MYRSVYIESTIKNRYFYNKATERTHTFLWTDVNVVTHLRKNSVGFTHLFLISRTLTRELTQAEVNFSLAL